MVEGDAGDGKIRSSKSPAASPILFVPKAHGRGLQLCVDFRGLNKITIANRYPLIIMNELQDRVRSTKKIDLKNGYHLIRVKKGDEWKIAYRGRYGLYEFLIMPFGLSNTPVAFQDMNYILKDLLDQGVVVYIDDILIYAEKEEHDRLVNEVLKRLAENELVISPEKYIWSSIRVEFLGYILSTEGMEMVEDKIEAIKEWKHLNSVQEVQSFLGFANFYRRFIKDFSRVCRPFTESTKGDKIGIEPTKWK
jgi:hypothetical protein